MVNLVEKYKKPLTSISSKKDHLTSKSVHTSTNFVLCVQPRVQQRPEQIKG